MADLYLAMGHYDQSWDFAERALKVMSDLKSGMQAHVEALIESLEAIPEPPELLEAPAPVEPLPGATPQPPIPGAPPAEEIGLYNDEELYNNSIEHPGVSGGDEDANSNAGRTPMM
jgi:hypothetical protein